MARPKSAAAEYFPECDRTECFCNAGGKCTGLRDNIFPDKDCPFFKPDSVARQEIITIYNQLVADRRVDVIEKYKAFYIRMGIYSDPYDDLDDMFAELRDFEDDYHEAWLHGTEDEESLLIEDMEE